MLAENIEELLPIVHMPTVSQYCQTYGLMFKSLPRSLFISIRDRGAPRSSAALLHFKNLLSQQCQMCGRSSRQPAPHPAYQHPQLRPCPLGSPFLGGQRRLSCMWLLHCLFLFIQKKIIC